MNPDPPFTEKKPLSLTRKAGIFTISRAVTILSQLLAMALLTRALSKEQAGLLLYFLLLYNTSQTFGQLGLPDSIFYFFEKIHHRHRKGFVLLLAKTLFQFSLAGAVLMLAIGWLGASKEGFGEVRQLIWIPMCLLLLELPSMLLPNLLLALDRAKEAAAMNIFTGLSQFAAMTLPLLLPNPVPAILWGLLGYGVLRLTVSSVYFFKIFRQTPLEELPPGMIKEVLRYSLPLSLAQLFWSFNRMVDKYLVQWLLPLSVFTVYSVGAYEIPIIPTIAYSVASVMMPQFVQLHLRGEKEALLALWFKSIEKVTVLVLPLVLLFLLAAEEFIALMFTEQYADAVIPFRIYTLILLQRVASYSNIQKALGSTRAITQSAAWLLFINIALCIPFVGWFGIAGAPLAALLANTFSWWYALRNIQTLLKVQFSEVFPFRFYGKTLAVAMLAAVPFFLFKNYWEMHAALKLALLATGYLALYVTLARASNLISKEDWRRFVKR